MGLSAVSSTNHAPEVMGKALTGNHDSLGKMIQRTKKKKTPGNKRIVGISTHSGRDKRPTTSLKRSRRQLSKQALQSNNPSEFPDVKNMSTRGNSQKPNMFLHTINSRASRYNFSKEELATYLDFINLAANFSKPVMRELVMEDALKDAEALR